MPSLSSACVVTCFRPIFLLSWGLSTLLWPSSRTDSHPCQCSRLRDSHVSSSYMKPYVSLHTTHLKPVPTYHFYSNLLSLSGRSRLLKTCLQHQHQHQRLLLQPSPKGKTQSRTTPLRRTLHLHHHQFSLTNRPTPPSFASYGTTSKPTRRPASVRLIPALLPFPARLTVRVHRDDHVALPDHRVPRRDHALAPALLHRRALHEHVARADRPRGAARAGQRARAGVPRRHDPRPALLRVLCVPVPASCLPPRLS